MNDQEITMMQRQMPLINQMKNQELARNQALMNTMTNNYSRPWHAGNRWQTSNRRTGLNVVQRCVLL